MGNSNKEMVGAFEQILESFEDACVLSKLVSKYNTDQTTMERSNDVIWRPQPYIASSYDGADQTANFGGFTQLSVPATIGFFKSSNWSMYENELRDAITEGRLGKAAKEKLASDINVAVMNVAAKQGTLVVKRTTAATGFDDIAQIDSLMNEQGIQMSDRHLALSSRDYNGMTSNLAARSTMTGKPEKAYTEGYVGDILGFKTYKLDYANSLTAAAGGGSITMSTLDAGANYYTPAATTVASTGELSNVDNRYQTITVSSTTNVAAGDCFTVAGLYACHHITKGSTGQLKTFRVISVPSSTTLVISPPMITNQGGTDAETVYQNCIISTKASNSAITFLNTVTASVNPFWLKDAIEILPGRIAVPTNAGVEVMRGTTSNGLELVMSKSLDINTYKTKFRLDVKFGVVNTQPQMSGIMLFSQS
ncbi:P22 coat protein [Caudoviricetes sp.]|nr:P22 coat protein [Caudoviricetes sp.]